MKKYLFTSLFALSLLFIAGCNGTSTNTNINTANTNTTVSANNNTEVNQNTIGEVKGESAEPPAANLIPTQPEPRPTPQPEPEVIPQPKNTELQVPPTPTPEPQPAPKVVTPPKNTCCKICSKGKACGDSCISRSYTCHKGPGCACDQ
ncbi:MAG: hypothetical protein WC497_05190 [Patescibacteria group bacterium]